MACCTFFGHRECPDSIERELQILLQKLIVEYDVDQFFVGNQGQFDAIVHRTLVHLFKEYPHIRYCVVLAYMPKGHANDLDSTDIILPEGIELVHPRYAISWRNHWMLQQSEYVITYITHNWGGAATFATKGKKQGKTVWNLSADL